MFWMSWISRLIWINANLESHLLKQLFLISCTHWFMSLGRGGHELLTCFSEILDFFCLVNLKALQSVEILLTGLGDGWNICFSTALYLNFYNSKMVQYCNNPEKCNLFSLYLQGTKVLGKLPTPNTNPFQIPEIYWNALSK